MYFAYVDESGDRGINGSRFYVLGCVLVRASQWAKCFDGIIAFHVRRPDTDPMLVAWEYLIQRLENLTRRPQDQVLIFHDEGEPEIIKRVARRFRRFGTAGSLFGGGYQIPPFIGLLDDPVSRNSRHSYFLQLADLNAYAAFRRTYAPPQRAVQIVPQNTWDRLGAARFAAANRRAGGPNTGIVFWPRQ